MPPTPESAGLTAALEEIERKYVAANPISQQLYRAAHAALPGGNTRTSMFYSPFPVTFRSGESQYLTDADGHVYVDLLGEYSAGLYGHSHPVMLAAAQAALSAGIAFGGPNEHEAEFAALLKARFPSVDLLRFTNSGTEANLMAIATARAVTGRDGVIVYENGYHGSVLSFRGNSPLNVPYPFTVCAYNDIEGSLREIEQNGENIAALVIEPMLGGGGVIPASREFLVAVQDACRRHGIVFILDEVMTSRLGPGGLQQVHGLTPDLTTFGKYLGGGFSFGAFGGTRRLMERYDPAVGSGHLAHPGTFNNNTLTMAVGATGLREVFTAEVARAHNARGDRLRERLNGLFAERGVTMQATGIGSLIGLHFQTEPIRTPGDVVAAHAKRALLHLEMMARGFYFARRGYLALSLALTDQDLDHFLDTMASLITDQAEVLR